MRKIEGVAKGHWAMHSNKTKKVNPNRPYYKICEMKLISSEHLNQLKTVPLTLECPVLLLEII